MLPRAMRHVLRPSKLTLAFALESKGMWISTSEASGTTNGLQEAFLQHCDAVLKMRGDQEESWSSEECESSHLQPPGPPSTSEA